MRTSFAVKNTVASIGVEIITAISGIILPRFFISTYGSSVNGLVSSIGQFITYMGLVEAGVSAAATVELYRPLATNDHDKINEIVSAAKSFYIKSGTLFVILDLVLIVCYPFIVRNEIVDSSFVRLMILVLSLSGLIDYFILGKYRVLLVADQKTYIIASAQAIGTIITLVSSILLIRMNVSAILVKGVVGFVYFLRTLFIMNYVTAHYRYIDFNHHFSNDVFPQRQSALFHQIIGMICNNTDIVLLTVMLQKDALIEVSVYAAYNMVAANLTALFNSISRGIGASFGNIIAGGDRESLDRTYNTFELLYFMLLFLVYSCMSVLLFSFITLYSSSFYDKELYLRWSLVVLFTACGIVQNIRIPGMTIQIAAGHFKQTQGAAMLEAVINFGISISLVRVIGINGVLLGTLAAYLYRSTYVVIYNTKHFVLHSLKRTIFRILRNLSFFGIVTFLGIQYIVPYISNWRRWFICAGGVGLLSSIGILTINYIFEPIVVKNCVRYIRDIFQR